MVTKLKSKSPKKLLGKSVYGTSTKTKTMESHTLSILVDNEPGSLSRVIGLFSGRGYNIDSLTVTETDQTTHLSRINIVTSGTVDTLDLIKVQLESLVQVQHVSDLTVEGAHINRELALVKVNGIKDKRVEAIRTAEIFRANVVDSTLESFIFEITGTTDKIDAFVELMIPLGLVEVSRSGVAAISRGTKAIGE